ncbi:MAG: RecQ family ATP-dependent DNA helicase [Cyanobacteria bacterium P01_H01_bin.15]
MSSEIDPAWQQVKRKFQQIWGYADFRAPQGEVVAALLAGQDALVVMPTGSGKSVCFQLPALLSQGLTLVVSPLVALMEDQVQALRNKQLPAALLHSELPRSQKKAVLRNLPRFRLLYLSPETLLNTKVWAALNDPGIRINGFILDEAHCLAQWGETFRPVYERLGAVRPALTANSRKNFFAIAAFTATANPEVQRLITRTLRLQNPQTFLRSPYRANLNLEVHRTLSPACRRHQVRKVIQQHPETAGLVYLRSRTETETLAAWLRAKQIKAAAYHAGLAPNERRELEQAWLSNEIPVMVCTSAFGMGINKPDCRWVVHYQAPSTLSEYLQEVGRAGRDGQNAQCVTLVSEPTGLLDPGDRKRAEFFAQQLQQKRQQALKLLSNLPPTGEIGKVTAEFPQAGTALAILHRAGQVQWLDPFHYQLNSNVNTSAIAKLSSTKPSPMARYLRTKSCRWRFLLSEFGFTTDAAGFVCGHCDRCRTVAN